MILLRMPAHTGLVPQVVQWQQPTPLEEQEIGNFFNKNISGYLLKKVDSQPQELVGYYKISGPENAFVKIISNKHSDSHFASEKVATWLCKSGVETNSVRAGFPKRLNNHEAQIFVYDYIDYEFTSADPEQLRVIGEGLGAMHALLREYPERQEVKSKGLVNNQMLRQRLLNIQQGKWECKTLSAVTEILCRTDVADLDLMDDHAQMIHGDMNYGNILIDKNSGRPVFIDFEDSVRSWLTPLYDLAFIMQRFILIREETNRKQLLNALVQGYRNNNRIQNVQREDALYAIYRMISIRSMLLLSLLPEEDQMFYRDEYEKFVWLFNDSESKQSVINDTYSALLD